MLVHVLVSLAAMASFSHCADLDLRADTGNWTVGGCILAQFAMEVSLHPNKTDGNATWVLSVPATASADPVSSTCGTDEQKLNLDWSELSDNSTTLNRNVTLVFSRRNDTRP